MNDYDVIILTETWLNEDISSTELFDDRYDVYRRDRKLNELCKKRTGGGVLIAILKKHNSIDMSFHNSLCEDLWVKVQVKTKHKTNSLCFCAVYIPSPVNINVLEHYLENAGKIISTEGNTFIAGDFNLTNINWLNSDDSSFLVPETTNCLINHLFTEFVALNGLEQFNCVRNDKSRVLDLVLANTANVKVNECNDPLSKIDIHHPPLMINLDIQPERTLNCNMLPTRNYHKADYEAITQNLDSINWTTTLESCRTMDDMVETFYEKITSAISNHVPFSYKVNNNKHPPWFTKDLIKLLKQTYNLRIRVKKYNNAMDKVSLGLLKERCRLLNRSTYMNYIKTIEARIKTNSKYFWTYIKHKRKNKSTIPEKMILNNEVADNSTDICQLYAKNFSSVYNQNHPNWQTNTSNNLLHCGSLNVLSHITLTEDMITSKLKCLDVRKGPGPDELPPILLAKCAKSFATPLTYLFNYSLQSGCFPTAWKRVKIVPIFKNGRKNDIQNYRPISIISIIPKVFELLIYPNLYSHLKNHIVSNQHGFFQGRSTHSNLVAFAENVIEHVDRRIQVDAVYTDFSKAFDKVDHQLLIQKLEKFGIHGPLLLWFQSYLSDRMSYVVLNGTRSEDFHVTSGVPQGSHLGPLLFNIFINSIIHCFHHAASYLFADDLKLTLPIKSMQDYYLLQADLDRLVEWCKENRMSLNIEKCFHIKFCRNKNVYSTKYSILGNTLKEVNSIRDLGILMDSKLTYNNHIDKIISNANKMLGFVLRTSKPFNNPQTKIILYKTLVRSNLEYCSQVWSPHYNVHKQRVERVQKRFLHQLSLKNKTAQQLYSYKDRALHFKLQSLNNRRKVLDLCFLHKLMTSKINTDLLSKISINVPSRLPRSHTYNLFRQPIHKTNLGDNSPLTRATKLYNAIWRKAELDINHDSLNVFKRKLYNYFQLDDI